MYICQVAGAAVLGCWAWGFLWAVLPVLGWNEYRLEGAGISCSVVWESALPSYTVYIFAIFFVCLVFPVSVMTFCYFHVFSTVSKFI